MDFGFEYDLIEEVTAELAEGSMEDSGKELLPSVRLKSALKTLPDYLKNRNLKRHFDELTIGYDLTILSDSVTLFPKIWDLCLLNEKSRWGNFLDNTWPKYGTEYTSTFLKEIQLLCGQNYFTVDFDLSYNILIKGQLQSVVPSLLPLYTFVSFVVTIQYDPPSGELTSSYPVTVDKNSVYWSKYSDRLSIGIYHSWVIVKVFGKLFLIHRDHLLNWNDKLGERLNVLVFSLISRATKTVGAIMIETLMMIFKWGDNVIANHGSDGFLLISNYEALVVGVILQRGDKDLWDVGKFLRSVIEDVQDELVWAPDYIRGLLEILSPLNVDQLGDLHGLYRIWGHPEVLLERGLVKMRSVSLAKKSPNTKNLQSSADMFKEIFFLSYRRKHGHYPNWRWVDRVTTENVGSVDEEGRRCYLRCQLEGNKKINVGDPGYYLQDWGDVSILKTFEIPYSWNLAHNIKDKAVSPDRLELREAIRRGLGVIWQDARRTVLKWVKLSVLPMRDFLTRVDMQGLPIKDLIIGLYAKERELKRYPRFFSLMSFFLRLYTVSTEQLLGDYLLPYFPQITMSSNLLEMTKKMLSLSGKLSNDGRYNESGQMQSKTVSFSINIDFKKWNQQMRYQITEPIFRCLDACFGWNNVYLRTHDFFRQSILYLCSGEYTPEMSGEYFLLSAPWSWDDDESGKEGLRQKGWTIMTVCMIEFVMRRHNGKSQLIGGGDNQVLIVTLETDMIHLDGTVTKEGKLELKSRMEAILKDLDQFFCSVGLPLKINETWVSPDLFMYNKIMCYQGRSLRSSLKSASRTFPFSDEAAMTIHSISSTLGTSIKSICSRDFNHVNSYIFSRWVALLCCFQLYYYHPLIHGGINNLKEGDIRYSYDGVGYLQEVKKENVEKNKLLFNLCFFYRIFGGYALGVPSEWVMRGFPDPLTGAIAWVSKLVKSEPDVISTRFKSELIKSVSMSKRAGEVSYLHLLSDPISINHDGEMHGLARLREESENAIINSDLVTNSEFKKLASICHSRNSEDLIKVLCSSTVLEPKFLHEIYGATLYGYFNSIVSRVDKSTTIMRLNRKIDVMKTLRNVEEIYIRYSLVRYLFPYDVSPGKCSRTSAQLYRDYSWGKHVSGVTVPSPVELFSSGVRWEDCNCDENYILVNTMQTSLYLRELGPLTPYLGSFTDEKFKLSPIAGAFGDESVLKKSIHLQKLRYWRYNPGTDLYHVIVDVLKSECNLDPDGVFMTCTSGSSATHRFGGEVLSSGSILNLSPDPYRFISMTTSTLTKRAKGGRNDMIHFQACLLWISSTIVNQMIKNNGIKEDTLHYHEMCPECVVEVETVRDDQIQLSSSWKIPMMANNPLAYVDSTRIQLSYSDVILCRKFTALGGMTDIGQLSKDEVTDSSLDSISTDLYLYLMKKIKLTQSQVSKMVDNNHLKVIFSKMNSLYRALCIITDETSEEIRWERLGAISCSEHFIEYAKEKNISMDWKVLNQKPRHSRNLLKKIILESEVTSVSYLTTTSIDPLAIIISQCLTADPTIANCKECLTQLTEGVVKRGSERITFYHCKYHVPRMVPIIRYLPMDGYTEAKRLSTGRPTIVPSLFAPNAIVKGRMMKIITEGADVDPIRIPFSGMITEYQSGSEIYSLCNALLFIFEQLEGKQAYFIVDCNWNMLYTIISLSRLYAGDIRIFSFFSDATTSGSEYDMLLGFRSTLNLVDRGLILLGNYNESLLMEDVPTIQVVSKETSTVFDVDYITFSLLSARSLRVVTGQVLSQREFFYPSVSFDKATWCVAKKSVDTSSYRSLIDMRGSLIKRPISSVSRRRLEDLLSTAPYPVRLINPMIQGIGEIHNFRVPKYQIDLVANGQKLIKLLEGRPIHKRGGEIEGVYKMYCHAFIVLLAHAISLGRKEKLIRGIYGYRYNSYNGLLHIKRSYGHNALIRETLIGLEEIFPCPKLKIKITGWSLVHLGGRAVTRKGIFLTP